MERSECADLRMLWFGGTPLFSVGFFSSGIVFFLEAGGEGVCRVGIFVVFLVCVFFFWRGGYG